MSEKSNELIKIIDSKVNNWDNEELDEFMANKSTDLRYASFDYCYNHFYKIDKIQDMEKSCAILWSYLSSWGMLRGSTNLLKMNYHALIEIVNYIEKCGKDNPEYWDIDFPYSNEDIVKLSNIYNDIEEIIIKKSNSIDINNKPTNTLVTKIMLGIFASVPAFDNNVASFFNEFIEKDKGKTYIKNQGVNEKTCNVINKIEKIVKEEELKEILSNDKYYSNNFDESRGEKYTKAKLIDMYCFNVGAKIENFKKKENNIALNSSY